MSDYIYSSSPQVKGALSNAINTIYVDSPPDIQEYHGEWGSLAVSQNLYNGFKPYETEKHLMVVIGGPVLYFRNNDFLTSNDSSEATESIYEKWILNNNIQWDEDLSGPFSILLIDKVKHCLKVITDLMSFIPVYSCHKADGIYLGTHIDSLAKIANEGFRLDSVSLADFVLNGVITYPYTAYQDIRQLAPSSETTFNNFFEAPNLISYWEPKEFNPFSDIQEAAESLRTGLDGYINRVTNKMDNVAQFISAGEDSRSLSGMLPKHLKRDAFVFLDHMNREGIIAEKAAAKYDVNFIVGLRKDTHYLDMLPRASKLVGTGHQFHHAHSLGFDKQFKLAEYPAVFGGYLSDSILKAPNALTLADIPFYLKFIKKVKLKQKRLATLLLKVKLLTRSLKEELLDLSRLELYA